MEDPGQFGEFAAWAEEGGGGPPKLPKHLEEKRTRVTCGADRNLDTHLPTSFHTYGGVDGVYNGETIDEFKENFALKVTKAEESVLDFEMRGCGPALANGLRRTLIGEVETMAIEHVFFRNNTSIIHDEILAHRLGLVPIKVDPRLFARRLRHDSADQGNTIVMRLRVGCAADTENEGSAKVRSEDLEWLPEGSEIPDETGVIFTASQTEVVKDVPVETGILLAMLKPGQEIDAEVHIVKGKGDTHAKWSPVATAWYRLQPEVHITEEITGKLAEELAKAFEDAPAGERPFVVSGKGAKATATPGKVTLATAERVRMLSGEEKWKKYFQLRKIKNHFLFTIESTGILPPHVLLKEALAILRRKCDTAAESLDIAVDMET